MPNLWWEGGVLVSCYLFIIISSLKERSCLKHIRCFVRFGAICTILKNVKDTLGGMSFLIKLQAYITENNTLQ